MSPPAPLEQTDPDIAEVFRLVANRQHPQIESIYLGPLTCELAGLTAGTKRYLKLRGIADPATKALVVTSGARQLPSVAR